MKTTTTKTKAKASTKKSLAILPATVNTVPQAQPAGHGGAVSILAIIERAANNPRIDVRKMERLLEMHMQIMRTKAEDAYNNDLCEVQKEIQPVAAASWNEHTKSHYAKLEAVDDAIRPIYTRHGFSLTFNSTTMPDGRVQVICDVRHTAGHKERHELTAALDMSGAKGVINKTGVQGLGSTVSYLRRYLTCMIFNVIIKGEDKDGNDEKKKKEQDEFNERVKGDVIDNLPDVDTMKMVLVGFTLKSERIDWLNKNIEKIQTLAKAGKEDAIKELHALADKGK